jgi:hypothetical protein
MSSIHGPRMRKLGKFFGVSDNEISDIYDNMNRDDTNKNNTTLHESILDDDESSNNSETSSEDERELEYNSYYDVRVLYDGWDEFENLRENFREKIPEILENTDGLRTIFLYNDDNELRSKYPMEDDFRKALRDLVKGKNEPWVLETTRIIINALRGLDSTINIMRSSNDEMDWDELYIEMAYGVIMNIILETRENMGECELNRLCYFKCTKCECETTYLFNGDAYKDICASCWDNQV